MCTEIMDTDDMNYVIQDREVIQVLSDAAKRREDEHRQKVDDALACERALYKQYKKRVRAAYSTLERVALVATGFTAAVSIATFIGGHIVGVTVSLLTTGALYALCRHFNKMSRR